MLIVKFEIELKNKNYIYYNLLNLNSTNTLNVQNCKLVCNMIHKKLIENCYLLNFN